MRHVVAARDQQDEAEALVLFRELVDAYRAGGVAAWPEKALSHVAERRDAALKQAGYEPAWD